jgi:2,4-dienoyl-CoA reductase-like NADH-dependent reductase (Old Yellow Enzyme family)
MYSSVDGFASDWHQVHIGQYALGGPGLIMMEATAVAAEGRITPACLGLWSDAHVEALRPVVDFAKAHGATMGIQLAHAGRKASARPPHEGSGFVEIPDGGWTPIAPTAEPFPGLAQPRAMTGEDIAQVITDFADAARRAVAAGFDVVEIHGAHGYLVHQFLSPLVNTRTDGWGGDLVNRMRLPREIARAIRHEIPAEMPLFIRVSATDWVDGGWSIDDSVELVRVLKEQGVDLVDVSSGGAVPNVQIPVAPGYQVPLAAHIRAHTGVMTSAVGLIDNAGQAEQVLAASAADAIMLGRRWLRDPYTALNFAADLGVEVEWRRQYSRR